VRRDSDDSASLSTVDQNEDDRSMRNTSFSRAAASSTQLSRKESAPETATLGLNVVYTPDNGHKADIVFIHGLGGSSRMTWSKNKDPELFWSLTFLPLEPDICLARILTFGYNVDFANNGNPCGLILDFAKNLLYDLKYSIDEQQENLGIGQVRKSHMPSL
jgi:hypothetical protein